MSSGFAACWTACSSPYAAPTPTSVFSDPSVNTLFPGGNLRIGSGRGSPVASCVPWAQPECSRRTARPLASACVLAPLVNPLCTHQSARRLHQCTTPAGVDNPSCAVGDFQYQHLPVCCSRLLRPSRPAVWGEECEGTSCESSQHSNVRVSQQVHVPRLSPPGVECKYAGRGRPDGPLQRFLQLHLLVLRADVGAPSEPGGECVKVRPKQPVPWGGKPFLEYRVCRAQPSLQQPAVGGPVVGHLHLPPFVRSAAVPVTHQQSAKLVGECSRGEGVPDSRIAARS
eukprot:1187164-Prorocentrum_minimum.AAC.3